MTLSIVIPCYNEEKNIPLLLEKFSECDLNNEIEIILVNNGSKDNSQKILDELIPKYQFARTVSVLVNQGYGYGILEGLKQAKGEFLGWTHADLQTDPKDIIHSYEIIMKYKQANIFIKGVRKNRSFVDSFTSFGMGIFESMFLLTSMYEINAQPTVFTRKFYECWEKPPIDFSLDLYAYYMAKRKKLR